MKRILLSIAAITVITAVCISEASAQTPKFREKGYKGNVGITTYVFIPGITSSHGYMFNGTHYLGAGFTSLIYPSSHPEILVGPFIEYQAYILKRNSTPVVGVKLVGLAQFDESVAYGAGFSPTFGWSWGIGSNRQFGIMPYIGITALCDISSSIEDEEFTPVILPNLGVLFEF